MKALVSIAICTLAVAACSAPRPADQSPDARAGTAGAASAGSTARPGTTGDLPARTADTQTRNPTDARPGVPEQDDPQRPNPAKRTD